MGYQILFDYDGVLTGKVNFAEYVHRKYGTDKKAVSSFFARHLQDSLIGKGDLMQAMTENLESIGWPSTPEKLFAALYVESQRNNTELIDFIETELDQATLHLATNQDWHRLRIIQRDPWVKKLFHRVFCSCALGVAKPDQQFFGNIFQSLRAEDANLRKNRLLFIDDLGENVDAAEAFGFHAHLFNDLERFKSFCRKVMAGNYFPEIRQGPLSLINMKFAHAGGYSDILSEAETYHFLTESGPIDEAGAERKIMSNRNAFYRDSALYWSIVGENREFLGFVAMHGYTQPQVAVSFGIHPAHRRKGVATAAVRTVLDWVAKHGKSVEMATHKENKASYGLLTSLNLSYQGMRETKFGERHIFRKG